MPGRPPGVTDDEGNFDLTTITEGDGAHFRANTQSHFNGPTQAKFPPNDQFRGAFSDVKTSKFHATVEPAENVLEAFELKL